MRDVLPNVNCSLCFEQMDNSMMDWNMNSKMDDSLDYGPRYMQSEIDSWNGGGGGYK